MKYKLVKLFKLSGNHTSIYTLYLEEKRKTSFDLFLEEYRITFKGEINDILSRLLIMGNKTGAKEDFLNTMKGNRATEFVRCLTDLTASLDCIA